jgi:hypothetical protein
LSLQLAALKVQDAGSILTLGDGAGIGGLLWGANAGPAMTVDILAGGTLKFNSAGIFTLNPTAVMTVNASTLDVVSTPIVINGALTVTNGAHVSQGTAGLSGTPFTVGSTNTTGAVVHIGGGTSTLFSVGQTRIGQGAAALFDQTGGTVTFDKQLQVGNGTYSMAGGSMTTPRIVIGGSGPTSFNHSGGTVTVPGTGSTSINGISIGNGGTQTATYNLSGASASLSVPGTTTVGDFSVGTFNQSGGNNTAGTLVVGGRAGIAGQYFLSGNALLGAFNVTVGLNGNGQFHQSGGTHTATTLQLGQNAGSTGAYDISAGTLNLQNLNIQGGGNGQFVLNSGSVTVANGININSATSGSIYFIEGGTLSAGFVNVQDSFGSLSSLFTQIGGAVTLGSLLISGAHSNYSLTGGSLQVQFNETLAGSSFSQSDGSHTVNGTLTIGDSASYGLSGGTLTASLLQVLHNGVLFLSSGSSPSGTLMTVAGRVELDFGGASLTIPTTLFPDSAFNLQGDLTVASPVTLQGGTIFNTSLVRTPNVIVQTGVTLGGAGSVMPLVINKGLIEASGGALALRGSSLNNTGTLRNASGASLFIDATTLTNSGTVTVNAGFMTFKAPLISRSLTLAGGTLGTPLLTNTNGGSIRGFGQITGNVDNFAAIEFLGPTQIVGNFTNRAGATLTIRNDQTLITGQSVNNGTITTLNGKVIFDGGLAPAPVAGAPLAAAAPVPAGGGIDGSGIVSLNGASTLITSYVHQQELALNGTPTAPVVVSVRPKAFGGQASVLNTLTIPSSGGTMLGRLDLADTALLVNYTAPAASPLVSIRSAIISGNHGGDWTGNGITSSSAAANRATALGYAEATDVLTFTGGVASFQGQPADPTTVLVRHTLLGDATLDGVVDFNDLVKLAQNYNTNVSAITDSWWTRGDFTYDGTTDFNDLVKLAQNYNTALPDAPIPGASADFQRDLATAFATVPEPGALTAFALSGLLLTRPGRGRRRRMLICV